MKRVLLSLIGLIFIGVVLSFFSGEPAKPVSTYVPTNDPIEWGESTTPTPIEMQTAGEFYKYIGERYPDAVIPSPKPTLDPNGGWCFMLEGHREWMTTKECTEFHQMIEADFKRKFDEAKDQPDVQKQVYEAWNAYHEKMRSMALTPAP